LYTLTWKDQATANERIPLLLQTPAAVRWVSAEPLLGQVDIGKWLPCSMHLMGCRCAGPSLDWVVVGGESGLKARPMHPDWVRSLREQCQTAGIPFLFKQWGEWAPQDAFDYENGPSLYWRTYRDGNWTEISGAPDGNEVARCGKRRAGRLLDGVQHDGYPEEGVVL
jgi:protein gp37